MVEKIRLSTVSGGGYIGGSITWLLHKTWTNQNGDPVDYGLGLDRHNFPYGSYPMVGMERPVPGSWLSADLHGYRMGHSELPGQPTVDQFFEENQFEAYRVGYQTAHKMLCDPKVLRDSQVFRLLGTPAIACPVPDGGHGPGNP